MTAQLVVPLNYDGPSYPVYELQHDLGEFFDQHQDYKYFTYEDFAAGDFVCELDPEALLLFILQHPRYQGYVK